jgi:DNA (cytosine-5)-methyltransferase 1
MSPSVIDLFCGAGGFSLGAAQAGFRPLIGIDIDSDLLSSYRLNFPNARALEADISELDRFAWKEILRGVRPSAVIGGPPCQGFSRMGKRSNDDVRNQLIGCFMDQVCLLQPAFFIMENVEGLLDAAFAKILEAALAKVHGLYKIVGPLRINAADVGVPTDRRRVVVVGYDPQRIAPLCEKDFEFGTKVEATIKDAIADLPSPNETDDGHFGWKRYPSNQSSVAISRYANQMRQPLPKGVGWETALLRLSRGQVSGFHRTSHTSEVSRRFEKIAPGTADKVSRYLRLSWEGRCPTLRAGTGAERGSFQAARPIHPDRPRVVTVREAARLQGFPDAFVFHRTKWHSFRMLGNSVSPPVAKSIMAVIRKKMDVSSL